MDMLKLSHEPSLDGVQALVLINQFRKSHNYPELHWHEDLYQLALKHSEDMAKSYGIQTHEGFYERANSNSVPFFIRSFGENVCRN